MCGRENPGHLMFCQECGHRLATVASPPPTAGAAAPTSSLAATAAAPLVGGKPPPAASRPRPAAPEVSFAKRAELDLPGAPSLPSERTELGTLANPSCPLCGTANERGVHFCVTCGQPLVESPPSPSRLGAIGVSRTVVEPAKAERAGHRRSLGAAIEPARVIEVGAGPHTQEGCPRCGGIRDAGAQFCRFCGLPLASATHTGASVIAPAPPVTSLGAGPASARIVLITRDGSEGPSYSLGATTDLGRTEGNIQFPDDPFVSPRHARIVARRGEFFVRDLESTNGIFVRIPFSVRGEEDDGKEDKSTIRGHHTGSTPVRDDAIAGGREQPLSDQELFLVGQQMLRFEVVKPAEEAFGAASENGTQLFGTPAAPRYARLSQRTVEGVVRDVFHLRRAETVIGREAGDIVFTDDPFLSRRHAVLRMHGGGAQKRQFALADLGSSNGTFLRIRDEVRLRSGDHFRIGQQLLRFDIDAGRTGG